MRYYRDRFLPISNSFAIQNNFGLSVLNECIDFDLTNHEKTIEASGGLGLRVDRPEDLHSAFEQGLDAVRSGTPAIVNVVTQGRA